MELRSRLATSTNRGLVAFAAVAATVLATEAFVRLVAYRTPPFHGALFALPLMAVVFAVLHAGPLRAAPAVALAAAYALPFYLGLDAVFPRLMDRLILGATVVVVTIGMAAGAGYLKREAERMSARSVAAERERAEALRERNAALARANETLEAFSYVVSHDLKEPVRALRVYLDEAHERAASPDARAAIANARDAGARLSALLNGLLEVGRAGRPDPAGLHPVWIDEAVDDPACRSRFEDLLREREARLEVVCLHGTPPALATTGAVSQIVGNLFVNAITHNPKAAPLVRVRIQPLDADATMVETVVEDDGPGFAPEAAAALAHGAGGTPRSVRAGGFGLVIVRRAVEHLNGRVWLGRSPEGGAAVHFALPAASGEGMRADAERAQAAAAPGERTRTT